MPTQLPIYQIGALEWRRQNADASSLLAAYLCDLTNYSAWNFKPSGALPNTTQGAITASGVVIDNMAGTSDVTVAIGLYVEVVPRYQKSTIPISGDVQVSITGVNVTPRVFFFAGTFYGNNSNISFYQANVAAAMDSITSGTLDAYFRTLKWKFNLQLANGSNIDNLTDSGYYDCLNPVNSGAALPAGVWAIEHLTYSQSNLWAAQIARSVTQGTLQTYERRLVSGVWTGWQTLAGLSFRQILRNFVFRINQRSVSGTVMLTAGQYGHDGWKAGSSGCVYTFAVLGNGDTRISIQTGSLLQIVEAGEVPATQYCLSWGGSATGRIYQGGSPAYAASPIVVTTVANTALAVEFTGGTVDTVQCEAGASPSPLERRGDDLLRCQQWYRRLICPPLVGVVGADNCTVYNAGMPVQPPMRANPTLAAYGGSIKFFDGNTLAGASSVASFTGGKDQCGFNFTMNGGTPWTVAYRPAVSLNDGGWYIDLDASP